MDLSVEVASDADVIELLVSPNVCSDARVATTGGMSVRLLKFSRLTTLKR